MILRLDREESIPVAGRVDKITWGDVYTDQAYDFATLEDEVREIPGRHVSEWKIAKRTAFGAGVYRLGTRLSPHFGTDTPVLLDVPGYTLVEIHGGTTVDDTEGCILVGSRQDRENGTLHGAKLAQQLGDIIVPPVYAALKKKIRDALTNFEKVFIQVRNAPSWYDEHGLAFPKALGAV